MQPICLTQQSNRDNHMTKTLLLIAATATLVACSKPENPLITATDGQFVQWITPATALAPSCAAALYEPEQFMNQYNALKFSAESKISSVSEEQKTACRTQLQKHASEVGIAGN